MEKQIQQALGEYVKAHTKAKQSLANFPEVVAQLDQHFQKLINPLNVKLGLAQAVNETTEFGPVTSLAGRPFEEGVKLEVPTQAAKIETAEELAAKEVIRQVDELLPNFLMVESSKLLDEQEDMVLRGIAKRAGLPVTEEEPKKISVKYIDEIKAALKPKEIEL